MNVKVMVALLASVNTTVWAEDIQKAVNTEELSTVYVYGERLTPSTQSKSADDIKRTPTRNGNITELLRNNGAVQFSSTSDQSTQAGEIEPDLISFHGEPYYNNSFLLDGLSNSDTMNPGYSNGGYTNVEDDFETAPTTMYIAPGSPESFYVDSSLLKKVNIYDSNVPARYTNFTGGVVDAKLVNAEPKKASGRVSFRTTRSSWTNFHLSEDQNEEKFEEAYAENDVQPRFVKQIYNVAVNQPVSEHSAILMRGLRKQKY